MHRTMLRDDQWERIRDLLPGKSSDCGVTARDNRLFVEAVLWVAHTKAPWRDLPESFGHWHRVYVRYNRWLHKGVWQRIEESIADDPALQHLAFNNSAARSRRHEASKKQSEDNKQRGSHRNKA